METRTSLQLCPSLCSNAAGGELNPHSLPLCSSLLNNCREFLLRKLLYCSDEWKEQDLGGCFHSNSLTAFSRKE